LSLSTSNQLLIIWRLPRTSLNVTALHLSGVRKPTQCSFQKQRATRLRFVVLNNNITKKYKIFIVLRRYNYFFASPKSLSSASAELTRALSLNFHSRDIGQNQPLQLCSVRLDLLYRFLPRENAPSRVKHQALPTSQQNSPHTKHLPRRPLDKSLPFLLALFPGLINPPTNGHHFLIVVSPLFGRIVQIIKMPAHTKTSQSASEKGVDQ